MASHSSSGISQREIGIALRDEVLVLDFAQPLAAARIFRIVVVDHQRLHLGERQRLLHHLGIFAVGDDDLGLAVVEREGDDRRVEPRVERVEHALRHRHAVMAFQHRRRIGEQHRHGVAALDAALAQRRGQPPRARIELGVVAPQPAVNDGGVLRETPPPRARESRAASAAGNWPDCGRDRYRKAFSPLDVSPGDNVSQGARACQPRQICPTPSRTSSIEIRNIAISVIL